MRRPTPNCTRLPCNQQETRADCDQFVGSTLVLSESVQAKRLVQLLETTRPSNSGVKSGNILPPFLILTLTQLHHPCSCTSPTCPGQNLASSRLAHDRAAQTVGRRRESARPGLLTRSRWAVFPTYFILLEITKKKRKEVLVCICGGCFR